jgi:peptidoglycan/xylan/chitin deacetylase (PgdA/CDA1 family)
MAVCKYFFKTGISLFILCLVSCQNLPSQEETPALASIDGVQIETEQKNKLPLDSSEVPILCYHQILENQGGSVYKIPKNDFEAQIKMLHDSGYHSVLPAQVHQYLLHQGTLPKKPVMISFDDSREEHFSIAAPILEKYGFTGVNFIMTIALNKKGYMSNEQLKELSDRGHAIAVHTWDHHDVRKLDDDQWDKQLKEPKLLLEKITGKPVEYFAYPFGAWNEQAAEEIKKRGYLAAFQLNQKMSAANPMFTVRRLLVGGTWKIETLQKQMKINFH